MKKLLDNIRYILLMYVCAMPFMSALRGVLFMVGKDSMDAETSSASLALKAFVMGLRFDTTMSCYVLALPLAIMVALSYTNIRMRIPRKAVAVWCGVLFSILLALSAGNIPYFQQFYKPINASILNWGGELSFVSEMILEERSFLVYLLLFFVMEAAYIFALVWIYRCYRYKESPRTTIGRGASVAVALLAAGMCFIGIRGRFVIKSPIRVGTAYFCNNSFLNQLGLNPGFVFVKTAMEMSKNKKVSLMDSGEALQLAAQWMRCDKYDAHGWSRHVAGNDSLLRRNVVLILMESYSKALLDKPDRTPFMHELLNRSTYFENAFSSGIHTMNGVYSSLFSYPALLSLHPFKEGGLVRDYSEGWPTVFKQNGYTTFYATTHDGQFDNIEGYLRGNGVDDVMSSADYPPSQLKSNLGCPDDYMFRRSVERLNAYHEKGERFFATLMTASFHQPFIIPDYFTPAPGEMSDQVIEYADWAMRQFFAEAEKEDWYDNTIFVLMGDHGSPAFENLYDVSLSYHQIPIVIFKPYDQQARTFDCVAGQIDAMPTVAGMLGFEYDNHTFGIDLLRESRPYIFFSSDNSYSAADKEFYYVNRMDGRRSLYRYRDRDKCDHLAEHPLRADSMEVYSAAMIQTAYMFVTNKVR